MWHGGRVYNTFSHRWFSCSLQSHVFPSSKILSHVKKNLLTIYSRVIVFVLCASCCHGVNRIEWVFFSFFFWFFSFDIKAMLNSLGHVLDLANIRTAFQLPWKRKCGTQAALEHQSHHRPLFNICQHARKMPPNATWVLGRFSLEVIKAFSRLFSTVINKESQLGGEGVGKRTCTLLYLFRHRHGSTAVDKQHVLDRKSVV